MFKIELLGAILRELSTAHPPPRIPEPDLIMEAESQALAFTDSGTQDGYLKALYAYHLQRATRTIAGSNTVIDLGCGSGVYLCQLAEINPNIEFVGTDLSDSMLKIAKDTARARNIKNIEFIKSDITKLEQFEDQSFDAVTSLQAFHHLPTIAHLEQTFERTRRVLKPNGAIYFQDLLRLKHPTAPHFFANYNPEIAELTRLDGEHSMRAAFLYQDFKNLMLQYLPSNCRIYKTAVLSLYAVIKTPDREVAPVTMRSMRLLIEDLPKKSAGNYRELKLSHLLGGLK